MLVALLATLMTAPAFADAPGECPVHSVVEADRCQPDTCNTSDQCGDGSVCVQVALCVDKRGKGVEHVFGECDGRKCGEGKCKTRRVCHPLGAVDDGDDGGDAGAGGEKAPPEDTPDEAPAEDGADTTPTDAAPPAEDGAEPTAPPAEDAAPPTEEAAADDGAKSDEAEVEEPTKAEAETKPAPK